jgi:hypothetical protein
MRLYNGSEEHLENNLSKKEEVDHELWETPSAAVLHLLE